MKKDTDVLKGLNIMDYSLFVCLMDEDENYDSCTSSTVDSFRNIRGVKTRISVSIIDVLQNFNFRKLLESKYKQLLAKDPHLISCVDAD